MNRIHVQANLGHKPTTISETIGRTPLLELLTTVNGSRLLLKLEQFNPTGSAKIRMAKSMLDDAEAKGLLKPGGWIVESTSGNTGVGLAMLAAERGYRFTAIVDNHASQDKIRMMKAFGAEVICVSDNGDETLATAQRDAMAQLLADEHGACWTAQHHNPANSRGYAPLAEELIDVLGQQCTHLLGAVGTGGSLCGTAKSLKQQGLKYLKVIGVEPTGSIIFGGPGAPYFQSGTGTPEGADIGDLVEYSLIDEGVKVSDRQAFNTALFLAKQYALLVGGSSGGVIYQALQFLKTAPANSTVVALVCDGGEKYLQTLFNEDWMRENQLNDPDIIQALTADVNNLIKRNIPLSEGM